MRGWCSLKSIISLIKYNNNNEMSRETAVWCVTVAVCDAVAGVCRGGVRRGGVHRGGACCGGVHRGGESRGGGAPWWGALWWGMLWDVLWGCTVVGRDAGNLYPKQGKPAKWVEKPNPAVRKSLPKQPFLLEKVEKPISAVRKSLPKTGKSRKKVEKLTT